MMVMVMKFAAFLLCCILAGAAFVAEAADSSAVQNVYLLPMANGLDQYLANRLVAEGVFQVTTDPKKADAVFTDRLGEAFEQRLGELLASPNGESGAAAQGGERAARGSSFSRGKGTLFLVDTRTRAVLWSIYERPRNSQPGEMDRAARRIVEAIKRPPRK